MIKTKQDFRKLTSGIRNFFLWSKERPLTLIIMSIIFFLCFGKLILGYHFYQDFGATVLVQGAKYNWLDIGRFGLVFFRMLFGTNYANPYFEGALFFIALPLVGLVWGYFLDILTEKKNPGWMTLLFSLLFLTYPTFTEQYYFQFQSFEMVLGNLLVVTSLVFLYVGVRDKNALLLVLSVLISIFSFGIYQSFVHLYITGCMGMFLLSLKKEITWKAALKTLGAYMVTFLVSFGIYELLCKLFFSTSDYIANQIAWGNQDITAIKDNLRGYIVGILKANGSFFTHSYFIIGMLFVLTIIFSLLRHWKSQRTYTVLSVLVAFLLFLSPLLLTFLTGWATLNRAQMALPLMVALGFIFVFEQIDGKKLLQYLLFVVLFFCLLEQMNKTLRIVYTYDTIAENDKITATKLSYDLDSVLAAAKQTDMPIAFIGKHEPATNAACCDTTENSYLFDSSLFINDSMEPQYFWSTLGMMDYYKMIGMHYTAANEAQIAEAASYAADMPIWPADGSIQVVNGVIIVKISEINTLVN